MTLLNGLEFRMHQGMSAVVLTGAGISAESGVPIFRGKGSMWDIPNARKLARRAGPPWNTKGTWEFYDWRRQLVAQCEPNRAHLTITKMEEYFGKFHLITQNVDGLHQKAGTKNILELHGNMWEGKCPKDKEIVKLPETPLKEIPPRHDCGVALAPHVVQFGQPVEDLYESFRASENADLFLVVGTSAVVSPAREMPLTALENGSIVIEINPERTSISDQVTLSIQGNAGILLPRLWKDMLHRKANIK